MFQVAGCFLSCKSVYWFLMMMEFFWNNNLFSINLYIESEKDKEKEMFQDDGNCLYIERCNFIALIRLKIQLFHEAGNTDYIINLY